MPSFYCCSLNCWFFFFTGIENGILSPFILVCVWCFFFLLLQCLCCCQLCSPSFVVPAVCYCSLSSSIPLLPGWGAIVKIQVSEENSSYLLLLLVMVGEWKWGWKKQEIPSFQLSSSDLLLWPENRSLWVDERWLEANMVHTTAAF